MSTVLRLRLSPSPPRPKVDKYNRTNYNLGSLYVGPSNHLSIWPTLCPCLCLCSSASLCLCLALCPRRSASVCRFILLSLCLSRSIRVSVRLPLLFVSCGERSYIKNERCSATTAAAAVVATFIFLRSSASSSCSSTHFLCSSASSSQI